MVSLLETLLLSAVMGLSIFLSMPFISFLRVSDIRIRFFSSLAAGILIFLIGDVFSDASGMLYNGSLYGYGSNPYYDSVFFISLVIGFLALLFLEGRSGIQSQYRISFMIALGIGFQNLTEGLVFGSLSTSIGLVSVTVVVLVGFVLQNLTEGLPIVSPFFGKPGVKPALLASLLMMGGLPTIIGGSIGFFYTSDTLALVFEGLAIGSMLYVILPILRAVLRDGEISVRKYSYIGTFIGFALGFVVNLL
ncbi:MAG TPA: hypothetical protein VKU79_07450 [Thermoplasmataceae archaeon]|nr:hypothetical protein [Thermoplasmatales archaeon AK]HLH86679.1 hypothetical protein [Thermoplasmataceae archaeon]